MRHMLLLVEERRSPSKPPRNYGCLIFLVCLALFWAGMTLILLGVLS